VGKDSPIHKLKELFKMAKKDLQKEIRKGEGMIISEGTLKTDDLLAVAHDLLTEYKIQPAKLKKEIFSLFRGKGQEMPENLGLQMPLFWDEIELRPKKVHDASYIWSEDVFNKFNEIAPKGYYFGSSEGDGACIGFFKAEEEE
jgi:hypothetical protein